MEQETTSFWIDIKKYEDTLDKDPEAFCFAPLAEIYRKLGLLDDAISVASRGCEIHPEYVGGQMALGRACFEKGLKTESRAALEKVVRVTPDNLLAQKLLYPIYLEEGNNAAAERCMRIILSFDHEDTETQLALDSLTRIPGSDSDSLSEPFDDEEHIWDDLEILEELDDEEPIGDVEFNAPVSDVYTMPEAEESSGKRVEPLSTATMAELYASQGFIDRAIDIYNELLATDPDNAGIRERINGLKSTADGKEMNSAPEFTGAENLEISSAEFCHEAVPAGEGPVLQTLEKWLENIRRRR